MMLSWRPQDHIQFVTTCNPQWLRMYEFMLVACRRFINNCANSRTELWTQTCATRALANYVFLIFFMGMRHIPVCNIIAWLYMYACMCMIVWQRAHHVIMTNTRPYTVSNNVSSNMIAYVSIHVGWDTWWSSGGSAADTCCGSGGFRCRYLFRFLALAPLPLCSTIALYDWGLQAVNKKMKRSRNFQTVGDSTWVHFLGQAVVCRYLQCWRWLEDEFSSTPECATSSCVAHNGWLIRKKTCAHSYVLFEQHGGYQHKTIFQHKTYETYKK